MDTAAAAVQQLCRGQQTGRASRGCGVSWVLTADGCPHHSESLCVQEIKGSVSVSCCGITWCPLFRAPPGHTATGGDGYCGWATALHLSARGYEVCIVDNLCR